ncbi:hypothetical protein [Delftia acidovorans]|uniref:hypothetical protein n=1 Tax=Delftia acidovorans TaxID=80866 RepID=UPI00301AEF97
MQPAFCSVCNKNLTQEAGPLRGGWLCFADHCAEQAVMLSHPQGLAYFCAVHLPAAKALAHLPQQEAMARLAQAAARS